MEENVLVTGGAGFIGSHVVNALLDMGYGVIALDNLRHGFRENVSEDAILYTIDIMDASVADIFKYNGVTHIVHLAAQTSVAYSTENWLEDAWNNIFGTINLLTICEEYGIDKFFAASTAAVYGDTDVLPLTEESITNPLSPYALSKITMENYIKMSGFDYNILRLSNVYGERQNTLGEAGVVATFFNNVVAGKGIEIYGDGEQTRDFIYAGDVANVIVSMLDSGICNQTLNVSTNTETSINDLYKEIFKVSGAEVSVDYKEARQGDIKNSRLDNSKLKSLIDIDFTPLDEGFKKTYSHFKK